MPRLSSQELLFAGWRHHAAWSVMEDWRRTDARVASWLWRAFPRMDQFATIEVLAWAGDFSADCGAAIERAETSMRSALEGMFTGPASRWVGRWRRFRMRLRAGLRPQSCADLAPDATWVCELHGRAGVAGCLGPWRPAESSDGRA